MAPSAIFRVLSCSVSELAEIGKQTATEIKKSGNGIGSGCPRFGGGGGFNEEQAAVGETNGSTETSKRSLEMKRAAEE